MQSVDLLKLLLCGTPASRQEAQMTLDQLAQGQLPRPVANLSDGVGLFKKKKDQIVSRGV